tara:strand:+ start:171 stop:668 length:498 start_codon:yes stop_codon:yes gene_type:complete
MIIDATFWVAISFFIFIGLLVYFKIPNKIKIALEDQIDQIKNQVENAEKLKEEANAKLGEQEKRISKSKNEIEKMIKEANELAEKNVIKVNNEFHNLIDNRKKNAELKIKQMKDQAVKDIKNASVLIAVQSVEKLIKNSLDKSKLDRLFIKSISETKIALKKKSS